ncbi:hypothetical protein FA15DRAFT_662692 [Coprinopsis marcescibilis]|uniref:Copper-fist domain-containing protein n=1 Tax=Coprinopsis marcescibilis TaxID=230819 RepID=A0A5C3LD14_COPMA|nr:hypothetical protein FA15DRAFT_662692 [Coprinopsis marcescibilis]
MVYVNNQKFACESCIKGHRSSSCHHTDRPLFEIKKKGRPVSQCTKCRELRQAKKVHSKCTCDNSGQKERQEQLVPLSAGSKSRRYIPIVPALPNGLKDVLQSAKAPAVPADERQRVGSLLNPCACANVRDCNCQASSSSSRTLRTVQTPSNPLDALAQAASLRSSEERFGIFASPSFVTFGQGKHPRSRPPTPPQSARKRTKQGSPRLSSALLLSTDSIHHVRLIAPAAALPSSIPDFGTMSVPVCDAISGCTCGTQCACPGCVQHRGSVHASKDHKDCGEGCGTCVDRTTTELRFSTNGWKNFSSPTMANSLSSSTSSSASFLDQFFARAAALPPPPTNRHFALDRTDTSRAMAITPVNLPKLDCCGGSCLCPSGGCACRSSCGGACLDEAVREPQTNEPLQMTAQQSSPPLKSCCAAKRRSATALAA